MPLIHGKSKQTLKKNIETEMAAHPEKKKQDLAIAFAIQRKAKAKKMAGGGEVAPAPSPSPKPVGSDDDIKKFSEGFKSVFAKGGMAKSIMDKRKMADGGEVDTQTESDNEEIPNQYYKLNKEGAYEPVSTEEIMAQPVDSNEHISEIESDMHDMVSKIRAKLRMKSSE